MAKERQAVCKKIWHQDAAGTYDGVDFNFVNGHTIEVRLDDFEKFAGGPDGADDILRYAAIHGLSQKIGDEFSGLGGKTDEAIGVAEAVLERLLAGEWNVADRVGPARSLVAEAVIRASQAQGLDIDADAVRAKYMERSEAAKAKVEAALANSAVQAMVETIKSERAAARAAAANAKAKADGTAATTLASLV